MTGLSNRTDRVVVVGGGVIGAFCAWELALAGYRVTVLEQNKFGAGCSFGNCGYVSPSHVLPLAQPGTVLKTFQKLLQRNSPFSIRPSWSLSSIYWFWKFMRSCNHRQMLLCAEGLHALLQSSKLNYQCLVNSHSLNCQWQERGILFVFEHQPDFDNYSTTEQLIREHFGVGAISYSTEALVALEPSIKPVVAGAWHYQDDCHLSPNQLMLSLRNQLDHQDVTIVEDTKVHGLVQEHGKLQAVETTCGNWSADHFVFATGAWTDLVGRSAGRAVPIQPGKGYSITMPCPVGTPKFPIIFEDTHVAVTPFQDELRIGSTMEFVGFDSSVRERRIRLLRDSARRYLQLDWQESTEQRWFGWRPMTWDSKPLIGKIPKFQNAWICAGHGMLGISTAPASAQLLRELILGQTPHICPEHFSMERLL